MRGGKIEFQLTVNLKKVRVGETRKEFYITKLKKEKTNKTKNWGKKRGDFG